MTLKLTEDNKKYILNEHLRNISHIANKDYQKRIWIRGEGPEVDDFDDTVCDFFDMGDPILDDYRTFGITEIQHKLLLSFREQFKAFSGVNDFPKEFIDTPEWEQIMHLAKGVLKAFNYQKASN